MKYLIIGGTGSVGHIYAEYLKEEDVTIFSRNEYQQWLMRQKYPQFNYIIGDILNLDDVKKACMHKDLLLHLAAIKHVSSAEENPQKAIDINIKGTENVIRAVLGSRISKAIYFNTDKAIKPVNTYGATKMIAGKLWQDANKQKEIFSTIMSCNIWGSSGSVIEIYKKMIAEGKKQLPISDPEVERFFTLKSQLIQALNVLKSNYSMNFHTAVLRVKIIDIIKAFQCEPTYKGLNRYEKLKEDYFADEVLEMATMNEIKELIRNE